MSRPAAGATTPGNRHGLDGVPDAGAFLARVVRLERAAPVRLRAAGVPGRVTIWAHLPWRVLVCRTVAGSVPEPGDVTVAAAELLAELERGGTGLPVRRDEQWRWPLPPAGGTTVDTVPGRRLHELAAAAAQTLRTAATQGVGGRPVGQRALRDALLDHVALVVTPGAAAVRDPADPGAPSATADDRIEIPQRLIQAVVRMNFLGPPTGPVPGDREGSVDVTGPGAGDATDPVPEASGLTGGSGATAGSGSGTGASAGSIREVAAQVCRSGRWIGLSAPYGVAWLPPAINLMIMR